MNKAGPLWFFIAHHLLACIVTSLFVTLLYGMRRIATFSDKRNPEMLVTSMGEYSRKGRCWDQGTLLPRGFYVYLCLSRTHIIQSLELETVFGSAMAGHRTRCPVYCPKNPCSWGIPSSSTSGPCLSSESPDWRVNSTLYSYSLRGYRRVNGAEWSSLFPWFHWPLPICSFTLVMKPTSKGTSDGVVRIQASVGPGMRDNFHSVGLDFGMWHA